MTHFFLLRHGSTDVLDVSIAGWNDAVGLNARGLREVQQLAAWLAAADIAAIYASPIARTRQSAAPLARMLGLTVTVCDELAELRFGDWTGASFAALQRDPQWQRFNAFRSGTRMPSGETMLEVQARAVSVMLRLRDRHPGERVALFTHGDVIKAIITYFLGMPVDLYARLEIAPGSATELELGSDAVRILSLNRILSAIEQTALDEHGVECPAY